MEIKKALVVGLGSIGIRHVTMFNTVFPGDIDIAVLRRKQEKPFKFIKHYFTDPSAAIAWKPDVVIIASPSHTHGMYLEMFKNSHVLLEKPAVTLKEDLKYLENRKYLVKVGYNYRYHPVFDQIKNYVSNRKIRKVELYHSDYLPNWHPWEDHRESDLARDGVGLTLCHGIDLLLELFNDLSVISVSKSTDIKLNINACSCMKVAAISNSTKIFWEIRADQKDVSEFTFKIEDCEGNTRFFDMNDSKHTRNDTFVEQMKHFKLKIKNLKDLSNNKEEFERAKRILEICQ